MASYSVYYGRVQKKPHQTKTTQCNILFARSMESKSFLHPAQICCDHDYPEKSDEISIKHWNPIVYTLSIKFEPPMGMWFKFKP